MTESALPRYSVQSFASPSREYNTPINNFFRNFYNEFSNNFTFQPYNPSSSNYVLSSPQSEYHFIPDDFLTPGKESKFVGKAEDVKEFVEEAFEKIFDKKFPNDIKISVLDEKQFRKLAPHPGTIGLSLNRRKQGLLSEIFVRNDSVARVMLTIGHELGHVLTENLDHKQDEEAKAYAFSLAWMKTIKEQDIAGLSDAIVTERPADNGVHNIAFFFVEKLKKEGRSMMEVWKGLVERIISIGKEEWNG
jgi:hypothetical protein